MAVRSRGRLFVESCGKLVAGGLPPLFTAPHSGSPAIFIGTMLAFAAIGAVVPIVLGKEMIGQIEVIVAEMVPECACRVDRPPAQVSDDCQTVLPLI